MILIQVIELCFFALQKAIDVNAIVQVQWFKIICSHFLHLIEANSFFFFPHMIEFCWCRHMWTKLNLRGHTSSIFAAGKQCGISLPINICMIVSYLFACSIYLWPIWQEIEVLRTSLPSIKGLRLFNPLYHSMGLFGKYHNTLCLSPLNFA